MLKLDADGPEGDWLRLIETMLTQGKIAVRTMIVECSGCTATLLHRLQHHHHYTVCLLDMHIDDRFIDASGRDAYSSVASSGTLRGASPAPVGPAGFAVELFSIRFMRHLYCMRANTTLARCSEPGVMRGRFNTPRQYVLTSEPLLEPRREHPWAVEKPSAARMASAYSAPRDGVGSVLR